jgi:DNA-binding beta-propeller fold protein YncE
MASFKYKETQVVTGQEMASHFNESAPRRLIATCNQLAHNVIILDAETLSGLHRIDTLSEPHVIIHDQNRQKLYVAITYRSGFYDKHGPEGHEIVVIDTSSMSVEQIVDVSPDYGPHDLLIDEKRDRLYVTCESDGGCVLVYDLDGLRRIGKIPTLSRGPHWIAILPDGSKAYTGNKDDDVSVLDLNRLTIQGRIPMPTGSEDLVLSPDGGLLYANDRRNPIMHVIDTVADKEVRTVTLPANPHCAHLTATGHLLISHFRYATDSSGWDFSKPNPGSISITDVEQLAVLGEIEVGAGPLGITSNEDGSKVYVNNANDGTMTVIDMGGFKPSGLVPLAAGSHDVILFDFATGGSGYAHTTTQVGRGALNSVGETHSLSKSLLRAGQTSQTPRKSNEHPLRRLGHSLRQFASCRCCSGRIGLPRPTVVPCLA